MTPIVQSVQEATPRLLSLRLKLETREAHHRVEDVPFIQAFLRGVVAPDSYRQMLVEFHHIYGRLETNLRRHATHPLVAPIFLPALWRQESLAADLAVFATQPYPPPSPAARRYGARINFVGKHHPALLSAHAYARYLGDLSGGQILGAIAAQALRLDAQHGLAFYAFPQIPQFQEFTKEYRARLDGLPVSEALATLIVAEAVRAFSLNHAVFAAL